MIEHRIKAATCRVACGTESGTGWLIARDLVITARHCVLASIADGQPVELFFPEKYETSVAGEIVAQSEQWDACLVSLGGASATEPLPVSLDLPREGETWQTFGYPKEKQTLGHRLSGTVAQVLDTPTLKIDIDLSIDPDVALQVYQGLSGAVVVCEGEAVGMIRLKVDGTIAALSLNRLESFLIDNGVTLSVEAAPTDEPLLADRGDFTQAFTEAVQSRAGSYLFLEGAHGYGKSTFCRGFRDDDNRLVNLGAYCLSDPDSALGADYRAQPPVFFDWLITRISGLITGKPPRKEEKSYAEQIRQTEQYLDEFSKYCAKNGQRGMFFIDGLNEVSGGTLPSELLGLLPAMLPSHVTVVLTAPNFAIVAGALTGKVKAENVFELPPLSDSACYRYCQRTLRHERRSPSLVGRICGKAKGHPLYLRYLIEFANRQSTDDDLNDFPVLTGPIEEYYEGIWAKLLTDADAVNVLALMARLRWGISQAEFVKALNSTEEILFVSVMSRIRHLLTDEDNTAIYHTSFAAFIIQRTATIDESAYRRLAKFCLAEPSVRYCALNRVFHLLYAGDNAVFSECNQAWVDTSVMLGVEPDALVADVDDVVKRAALQASADEFFRLTLLAQRVSFRYDTLFAQSARLIADALICLGRSSEALQHVLRLDTLIVGPDDALEIAFLLHRHRDDDEALMLLGRIHRRIIESYDAPMQLGEYLQLCSWHIQTIFLARLSGGSNGMSQVRMVMEMARRACDEVLQDEPSEWDKCLCPILARSPTYFLAFRDEYSDLGTLREFLVKQGAPEAKLPPHYLRTLCIALLEFEATVDNYHLPTHRHALSRFFADLEELIQTSDIEAPLANLVADALIRFGASESTVELFGAKGGKQEARPLQIKAKNGVDGDLKGLQDSLYDWRILAFLDPTFMGATPSIIGGTGWSEFIEHLVGALYCCDGRARRAKADHDEAARVACRDKLNAQVIEPLRFTLEQRASWGDSYAVPENVLPSVYSQLAALLVDCFPEELTKWVGNLLANADGQWGMYSEGFRASANQVLEQLTRDSPGDELIPILLGLLHAWRDHVLRGVENRHELVPEILRMIPIFTRLGATEEAEVMYQRLLTVSMGPTWYKEDQLGIMTEVLGNIAIGREVGQRLPQVAGYLERASGEMTFQRFVRAEKSSLIGQIARHGRYREALAYFRRLCCGSTEELWGEAQQGPVDKIGSLKGNRYPGGALDEQAAILALVRNSSSVPWALRWALLEIFHCGDSRHLTDYAAAFAKIANEVGALPELVRRAEIVVNAETPSSERSEFRSAFQSELMPELHADFAAVLAGLPPPNPPDWSERPEAPAPPRYREKGDDDEIEGLFHPGIFGRQKALREADKNLEEAERQWALGNKKSAKEQAVKVLKTAQDGGWGIWGNLSAGARRAEEILVEDEANAADIIRHYAPLIEAERHVPKWIPAQHLIGKVGQRINEAESQRLLDAVIDHVRLMVGDASKEIKAFEFLADDAPELSPAVEFFRFIVWLCNHPQWLRRERAAAMLLWLVEQVTECFSEAANTAFSMDEGYGPDILSGVLDGISARDPVALWDKLIDVLDLGRVTQELRHVSRMVVLERLATRADEAGSTSAKSSMELLKASFNGKREIGANPECPIWADRLGKVWSQIVDLIDAKSVAAWEKELEQLCSPLGITDAFALEAAVSASFRESKNRPFNRWESKLRHALNIALWPHMSCESAKVVEAILRIYNPSQPERTVQGMKSSFTDQLMAATKSGDYSAALGLNTTVLLNYHDMAARPKGNGISHIEVLCLLMPTSIEWGSFGTELVQSFCSSELPLVKTIRTPFETCCRLKPEVVFFDPFTPAIPLTFFQNLVGANDNDFVRQNWRYGRRNEVGSVGLPERTGCTLSVSRKAMKIPSGLKLAWLVWIDSKVVAFVDEQNNQLI